MLACDTNGVIKNSLGPFPCLEIFLKIYCYVKNSTRSFTGHMGIFKRGAFQLADQLQLPIVPITLNGPFDVLPRTSKWPKWHPLTMTIHDPIYPECKGEENVNRMMEESYQAIMNGLPEKYQGTVENPDQ